MRHHVHAVDDNLGAIVGILRDEEALIGQIALMSLGAVHGVASCVGRLRGLPESGFVL
jgi:hypothetical protein